MDNNNEINVSEENISQEIIETQELPQEVSEQEAAQKAIARSNGKAVGSLVLGIISIVFWFFGLTAIASVITGIVGILLASRAQKNGLYGGIRTAGFICSLIGLILGAIVFVACISCVCIIF